MTWPKMIPPDNPKGVVLVGVSRPDTVIGAVRVAVLLSRYYGALPMAVHVAGGHRPQDVLGKFADLEGERLFESARTEARKLGYPLRSYSEYTSGTVQGLRRAAEALQPHVLVLGHSFVRSVPGFSHIADTVARGGEWPVILVRFTGESELGRVLVPVQSPNDLMGLQPLVTGLSGVGQTQFTLLRLRTEDRVSGAPEPSEKELIDAAGFRDRPEQIFVQTGMDGTPIDSVLKAAQRHDLIIMRAGNAQSTELAFSGSLAEEVAHCTDLPILVVRGDLRLRSAQVEV